MLNPNYSQKIKDKLVKTSLKQQPGIVPSEDRYGSLQKNGFVSKTLHNVAIGLKEENEWIGEEQFIYDEPEQYTYEYSVIAQTKCTMYEMNSHDFNKIPGHVRKQMKQNALIRKEMITKRILDKYDHLKQIKKGIFKQSKENEKAEENKDPLLFLSPTRE